MDKTVRLLKDLTEASGVSGFEAPVKSIKKENLESDHSITPCGDWDDSFRSEE